MPLDALLMLLALPVLVAASAFFSGCETALFSLTRHQRTQLAKTPGVAAHTTLSLLSETRLLLITLLLGNMTVNVLIFVISSVLLIRLGRFWEHPTPTQATLIAAASVVPLLVVILIGEVLPKMIAARVNLTWARYGAVPLMLVHRALAPVRLIASGLVITPLARLIAPRTATPELSSDELESVLELSKRQGVIDADEERLLQEVLVLSQLKVRDLMIPRVDIEAFNLANGPKALLRLIRRTRLRRVPVYRGDMDNIEGLIHSREALLYPPKSRLELNALIRPIAFVPEQQRADQFLQTMRKTGGAFAIVVDEYGGTSGLIAIEDVVEHMVGGLPASYVDDREARVEQVAGDVWRVEADLAVHDWAAWFGKNPKLGGAAQLADVSTIGGLVMAGLGRLPREGEMLQLANIRFTVEKMDGVRIDTVLIERATAPDRPASFSEREATGEDSGNSRTSGGGGGGAP